MCMAACGSPFSNLQDVVTQELALMAGTLIAAGIIEGIDPLAGFLVATLSGCVPMQAIGWVLSKGTPPPQELLLVVFEHELSGVVIPPDPLSVRWGQVRETHRVLLRPQGARGM